MGFLLGAYGKLMAGKRVRQLQARMMNVQSQMRRATREVAAMEKMINSQQKMMLNNMRLFATFENMGMQQASNSYLSALFQQHMGGFDLSTMSTWDQATMNAYSAAQTKYSMESSLFNNKISSMQQMQQMQMQQMQTQIEQEVEMMKELQLQPLKDREEELMLEKDTLESQLQIAQADYDACKEMEKAGAQGLKPNYTGQG